MIASLLAGLGSSLLSVGSSALSSSVDYGFQKALQDDAQKHQIKMMQNAHQWEVGDLRKAGLNPILSAGGSPGNYSSSSGHVNMGQSQDFAKIFSELQGFSSAKDAQEFARENHKLDLASKEADLSIKELQAMSLSEDINSKMINSSLSKLDLDRRSRDWYKQFEDLRDIRNTYKNSTSLGRFTDDIEGTFSRMLLNSSAMPERYSSVPIVIKKAPSKSNFTKYQYKYHKN